MSKEDFYKAMENADSDGHFIYDGWVWKSIGFGMAEILYKLEAKSDE